LGKAAIEEKQRIHVGGGSTPFARTACAIGDCQLSAAIDVPHDRRRIVGKDAGHGG
jgi:hypothetical protein